MELYTVSEFHKLMSESGKESETEGYSIRMTQSNMKDRQSDALTLVIKATSYYWTKQNLFCVKIGMQKKVI